MLKIQEIREIIKLIDQSSIDEFSYEHEGSKIKLKKNQVSEATLSNAITKTIEPVQVQQPVQQAPVQQAPAHQETVKEASQQEAVKEAEGSDQANLHKITSPMVGTFYQSPSPDADAYVKVGSKVDNSSVVCIVEAMKLFNEIEAEIKGEIVEILVKDGQLVEYGQPLFLVKPE